MNRSIGDRAGNRIAQSGDSDGSDGISVNAESIVFAQPAYRRDDAVSGDRSGDGETVATSNAVQAIQCVGMAARRIANGESIEAAHDLNIFSKGIGSPQRHSS